LAARKNDTRADARIRAAESNALRDRAEKARQQARESTARLHDQLHLLWEAVTLRCVLVETADRVIAVQLFKKNRAMLTEPCRDADEAAKIAERLWDQFVEPV
jgi:hypothetical protein